MKKLRISLRTRSLIDILTKANALHERVDVIADTLFVSSLKEERLREFNKAYSCLYYQLLLLVTESISTNIMETKKIF